MGYGNKTSVCRRHTIIVTADDVKLNCTNASRLLCASGTRMFYCRNPRFVSTGTARVGYYYFVPPAHSRCHLSKIDAYKRFAKLLVIFGTVNIERFAWF